jgi:hypothetical protein
MRSSFIVFGCPLFCQKIEVILNFALTIGCVVLEYYISAERGGGGVPEQNAYVIIEIFG